MTENGHRGRDRSFSLKHRQFVVDTRGIVWQPVMDLVTRPPQEDPRQPSIIVFNAAWLNKLNTHNFSSYSKLSAMVTADIRSAIFTSLT